MLEKLINEMRGKPFTMVLILALYAAATVLWNNQASFASEEQMQAVSAQVASVKYTVERTALENRMANVESELFTLTQKVGDMHMAHKTVDQLYLDRINTLTIEKGKIERELSKLSCPSTPC